MPILERRKKTTKKKRRYVVRGQIIADIREGAGAFVILIVAAVAIAVAGGVAGYILDVLAPAMNSTTVNYGNQAVQNIMSIFVIVSTVLGSLIIGIIVFGFLRRIWREFAS
jgi:hypothetical protein